MTCPNCDANISEDTQFCPSCGYDFDSKDAVAVEKDTKKYIKKKKIIIIGSAILAFIIAVVIVVMIIVSNMNKGSTIAARLSEMIGKNASDAAKSVSMELYKTSKFEFLKDIYDYDYILESEDTVNISGVNVPYWVIFITTDDKNTIDKVLFYDYKVLNGNWKGVKTSSKIDVNSVSQGYTKSEVDNALQIQPQKITYNDDDTSVLVYKYFYLDNTNKNEVSSYITVIYDENDRMSAILVEENDYIATILK